MAATYARFMQCGGEGRPLDVTEEDLALVNALQIAPRLSWADAAEVLGLRLPRAPLPGRPGSGWLANGTRLDRVQVARHRHPAVEASTR